MSTKFELEKGESQNSSSSLDKVGPIWNNSEIEDSTEAQSSSWRLRLKMTVFLLVYTSTGAWIFQVLEQNAEIKRMELHKSVLVGGKEKLLTTIARLGTENVQMSAKWNESIQEALREYELGIDSVLGLGPHSLQEFTNEGVGFKLEWGNYLHVYFFVITLISTIGYGNIVPRTTWGRIFCVFYAMVGIPVFLIFIAQAGKIFAKFSLSVLVKICGRGVGNAYFASSNSVNKKMVGTSISTCGVVGFLFLYMSLGAVLINVSESWGFINSFYFCFITLTTVGFGDLIPLQASKTPFMLLFIRSVYTIFGLAITSTAIALMQKHYAETWANAEKEKERLKEIAELSLFKGVERTKILAGRKCLGKNSQTKQNVRP